MSVKGRLLIIKMAEKEKQNPRFFEEIKVDIKIIKKQCREKGKGYLAKKESEGIL